MTTAVSVVVNAHVEGLMLTSTLQSVRRAANLATKNGLTVELLIAADRPNATTQAFLAENAQDFRVFQLDHGDLGLSRQSAAEQATGEWTCFIDGDDLWAPNWIVEAVRRATEYGKRAVWHPQCSLFFGQSLFIFPHIDMEDEDFELRYLAVDNYWTSAVFAPTSLILEVPFLRSSLRERLGHEDWNWHCRTIEAGALHKVVPDTVHFIRRRPMSLSKQAAESNAMCLPHTLFTGFVGDGSTF